MATYFSNRPRFSAFIFWTQPAALPRQLSLLVGWCYTIAKHQPLYLQSANNIHPTTVSHCTLPLRTNGQFTPKLPVHLSPISQFLFKWVSYWGGTFLAQQLVELRLHYILFELGVFVVGLQLLKNCNNYNFHYEYYLNPLVIIELTRNLHNEGVLLFF